jgi:galactose-1-phosphate uridylyltransferase
MNMTTGQVVHESEWWDFLKYSAYTVYTNFRIVLWKQHANVKIIFTSDVAKLADSHEMNR